MLRRKLLMWRRRLGNQLSNITKQELEQAHPFFMQPLVFLSGWLVLALLFGFQEYADISIDGWKIPLWAPLLGCTIEFLLWGLIFLGKWRASICPVWGFPDFRCKWCCSDIQHRSDADSE